MAEHGPHCETCGCGCTCGYGGQHEPDKATCDLNAAVNEIVTPEMRAVLDVARLTVANDAHVDNWALIPLARAVAALRAESDPK